MTRFWFLVQAVGLQELLDRVIRLVQPTGNVSDADLFNGAVRVLGDLKESMIRRSTDSGGPAQAAVDVLCESNNIFSATWAYLQHKTYAICQCFCDSIRLWSCRMWKPFLAVFLNALNRLPVARQSVLLHLLGSSARFPKTRPFPRDALPASMDALRQAEESELKAQRRQQMLTKGSVDVILLIGQLLPRCLASRSKDDPGRSKDDFDLVMALLDRVAAAHPVELCLQDSKAVADGFFLLFTRPRVVRLVNVSVLKGDFEV